MLLRETPTSELVRITKGLVACGNELNKAVLDELMLRYGWPGCPPEDLVLIGELDVSLLRMLNGGNTQLPPRIRAIPGAKPTPVPAYYQSRKTDFQMNTSSSTNKNPHKVFVASSMEAKNQANILIRDLAQPDITFVPWWESVRPGRMFLSELAKVASEVMAALFVLTPDISGTFRHKRVKLPNQNVLFELGYFFTVVKPERIAIVKYGDTMIPSDLLGYTHISGSKFFKAKSSSVPGKVTKADFLKWATAL